MTYALCVFSFFAIYFVFYLQFICLYVFVLLLFGMEDVVCLFFVSCTFSACMCEERVCCDIFFRLHIYFSFYNCYIVFVRVSLESTTFYGCFV